MCQRFYFLHFLAFMMCVIPSTWIYVISLLANLSCEKQTHFRSSLLSLRKIEVSQVSFLILRAKPWLAKKVSRHGNRFAARIRRRYFRRERSDDRKCFCCSQAIANSNQSRFPLDFLLTLSVILPSVTRTLDNSTLPLTWSNFFPLQIICTQFYPR